MRRAVAAACALFAATPAHGDDDEEHADAEVVVTATRTPEAAVRATVRAQVVTRQEAERRGATNVAEALAGEPSVEVNPSAYGFLGSPSAIQIQGLDRERVLVLEDGERVIGGVGGAIDLAEMPLGEVERIEVVAGPMSSLYGTSAIGGVVNVITGPPFHAGPSGRLRLEGRYPWGVLGQGAAAWRRGRSWVGVDLGAQHASGVTLGGGSHDLALPEQEQYAAGARASAPVADGGRVDVKARWVRNDARGRSDEAVPGLGVYRVDLPERVDRLVLSAAPTLALGRSAELRLRLARQWFVGTTGRDRFDSPIDETRLRDGAMHSGELVAAVVEGSRTWIAGTRAEIERYEQRLERVSATARGDLVASELEEVRPVTLGSAALYAQLGWELAEWLTVIGGARGELHLRHGGVAAPRLALALRPLSWLSLRVAGGHGFRAPSARELGFAFDHSALGYRVAGNPALEPETSWGLSGDVSVIPTAGASLSAGVWANWIEDLIDLDLAGTGADGVDEYTYLNVAHARTFGAEAHAGYELAPRLHAEIGYRYTWTRDDVLEEPLAGRPPHTFTASLRLELPLGFEIYARQRVVTDAFVEPELRAPGFQTLDARLARDVWGGVRAHAGVLNVFGAQKDPLRPGDQRPLAGRVFYLGATAELPTEE
jgi:outer membrane receptor for ferrienterochelin and colicins